MKALSQLQELISSLQNIKDKLSLILFPEALSYKPQGELSLRSQLLAEVQHQVENHLDFCKSEFLPKIIFNLEEYTKKTGQNLTLGGNVSLNQPESFHGENLKYMKRYLTSHSEEHILEPILSPKLKEDLNNSEETGVKYRPFRVREGSMSGQQSDQSFYTAHQSQNPSEFRLKNLIPHHLETGSVRQDKIKIQSQESMERFQSMDGKSLSRSPLKNFDRETQTQTLSRALKIQKQHQTKIQVKKKQHQTEKTGRSKRSFIDVEEALLEIIYGKDLFPFINFYLKEVKQNRLNHSLKSSESSYAEIDRSGEIQSYKIQERGILYTIKQQEENQLMKYLTKGKNIENLVLDEVMEAKFQRLVIICFDTVVHTLKTMSFFVPLGQFTQIIRQIEREELNTYRQRCLGNQQRDIQKACKKVKKIMKEYRQKMKDDQRKRNFFNMNLEIRAKVI